MTRVLSRLKSTSANELTYKELTDELDEKFEIVKNELDRIKNRVHYRFLVNVSYPINEADKISLDMFKELNDIEKRISKLWNKVG